MNRIPVESSNLASVGYDPSALVLEVEFRNGAVYQYLDVPQNIYDGLRAADSKGKFLSSQIKGHFRYVRL